MGLGFVKDVLKKLLLSSEQYRKLREYAYPVWHANLTKYKFHIQTLRRGMLCVSRFQYGEELKSTPEINWPGKGAAFYIMNI